MGTWTPVCHLMGHQVYISPFPELISLMTAFGQLAKGTQFMVLGPQVGAWTLDFPLRRHRVYTSPLAPICFASGLTPAFWENNGPRRGAQAHWWTQAH